MIRLDRRQLLATATAVAVAPSVWAAASYPDHPPRLIVGFAPGGGSDFVARAISQDLAGPLGQPLIVDNRPGAGGTIAATLAKGSEPDGYTLLLGSAAGFVINPVLMPKLPYNPDKDFVPVGSVARFGYVLMARKDLPYKSIAELVAYAKQHPDDLTIGSAGNGSNTHLVAAAFQRAARIELRHIPYKGTTPALTDLSGGSIDLLFDSVPTVMGQVKSGSLRGLAVSGTAREPTLPELPTLAEAGANMAASNWFAIFAPARTPAPIIERLNTAIQRSLSSAALREQFVSSGNTPLGGSANDLHQLIARERASYGTLIKESGITLD